jgi:hypothetical protein
MNAEQKALKACGDYARLSAEIRRLTRLLSDSLAACPGVNGHLQVTANWPADQTDIDLYSADETHLKRAYAFDTDDSGRYFLTYGEQLEVLWPLTKPSKPARRLADRWVRLSGLSR